MDLLAASVLVVSLLITTVYAWRRIGRHVTLSLLLFGSLLVVHGIPMLIYVFGTGPDTLIYEAALAGVDRAGTLAKVMFAVALMFACLILGSELGIVAAPRLRRLSRRALKPQTAGPPRRVIRISPSQRLVLWLIATSMFLVSLVQSHFGQVLGFFTFDGSEIERTLLRAEGGGSPFYLYNVVLYSVAPFLVMVSWADDARRSGRLRLSMLTIALFGVTLLGKFGTLSKAPPVIFLLQLLLMAALLRGGRLNLRLLIQLLAAGLALFATIVRFTFPELELDAVFRFLYYRTFDIPNEALLEYFAAIPSSIPHTWGTSVLGWLGATRPADALETYYAVAEVTRDSILSTSNAMFIGDAWAQFSWGGVVAASVFAGFFVRIIDMYSHRAGRSDLSACLTAGGAFGVFTSLSTAFTTALVTGGLATLPIISAWFLTRRLTIRSAPPGDATATLPSSVSPQ